METLMGQPEPKKRSFIMPLILFLLGVLVGGVGVDLSIAQPAQKNAVNVESQRQGMVKTFVNLGRQRVCAAKTFDAAVELESLVRDTMDALKAPMPEDVRQDIELCAEKLRSPKIDRPAPKPVHKKIHKKK